MKTNTKTARRNKNSASTITNAMHKLFKIIDEIQCFCNYTIVDVAVS